MRKQVAAWLCQLLIPISLQASLYTDTYDMGPWGVASTGAVSATISDSTSGFYNVAGFLHPHAPEESPYLEESVTESIWDEPEPIRHPHSFFDFSYTRNLHAFSLSVDNISQDAAIALGNAAITEQVEASGVFQFGFAFDLLNVFSALESIPTVLGVSLALPDDGSLTAWNDLYAQDFNFIRYGRNAKKMDTVFAIVVQPWLERLSVGLGAQVSLGSHKGLYRLRATNLQESTTQYPNTDILIDYSPEFQITAGLQYRQPVFSDQAYFGISYRQAGFLSASSLSISTLNDQLQTELDLAMDSVTAYSPQKIGFGMAYEFAAGYMLSLEVDHYAWSAFPRSQFRYLHETAPTGFSDILNYRTAVSIPFKRHESISYLLIGGFSLEKSPVPDQVGTYNFLDMAKKKIGAGLQVTFRENSYIQIPTTLFLAAQLQLMNPRSHIKANPDLSVNYNDVDLSMSGNTFVFTAGIRWPFEHEED